MPNNENNNIGNNLPNMSNNQMPTTAFQPELNIPKETTNMEIQQPIQEPTQPAQSPEEGGLTAKVIPMIFINTIIPKKKKKVYTFFLLFN